MCKFFQKSDPRNIDKNVSDIRISIRFPFESSLWISLSGCKLTILPDIQPVSWIVIISVANTAAFFYSLLGLVSLFLRRRQR